DFKQYDRLSVHMACGTGKTLIGLWSAETLNVQSVIIFLPTLSLLRQFLHEWLRETSWSDFSFIAVCSDETINQRMYDEILLRESDLNFPVTTDSQVVRKFLKETTSPVKLVFSTYQSAYVVSQAMQKNDFFDLGIFDEAHKTATPGSVFNFALEDQNLRIKK